MTQEHWKMVPKFEYFSVSNLGRVRHTTSDTPVRVRENNSGHHRVRLRNSERRVDILVHRLVAAAFLKDYSHERRVEHKDGNYKNNSAKNLVMGEYTKTSKEQHLVQSN